MPVNLSEARSEVQAWPGLLWPLPLVPFEHFLLAHDTPHNPMVFRVLLRFEGPVERQKLNAAYRSAVLRQPLFNCHVAVRNGSPCWIPSGKEPSPMWESSPTGDREISQFPIAPIDITQQCGIRTRLCEVDEGLTILLDIHHCCSDGQGARQFLGEWMAGYERLVIGDELHPAEMDFSRLASRGHYRLPDPPIGGWEGLRNFWKTVSGRTLWLPERKNTPAADLGHEFLFECPLGIAETDQLRRLLRQQGLTINDVGLAATMTSLAEFLPSPGHRDITTVLHPVDLRLPSDLKTPACNRVGVSFLRRGSRQIQNPSELLSGVRLEMQYVKRRYVGAEFLRGLAAADSWPGMVERIQRWRLFRPTVQFTCLGDTTRAIRYPFRKIDGAIYFADMRLSRISGFMQLGPELPLSITACETSQVLSLTFRSRGDFLSAEQTARLSEIYLRHLKELPLCHGQRNGALSSAESRRRR